MVSRQLAIVSSGLALLVTACSSLTHSKNEEAVAKVRKIAVTGLSVVAPIPAGLRTGKESAPTDEMYSALTKSFGKNVKWQVLNAGDLRNNPTYRKLYDDTMKGFQNKMPVAQGKKLHLVEGVMDYDCARLLGKDGRNALIKALGVDAIVTATVDVMLNGTTVFGVGNLYPQSRLSFMLYKLDSETPEWFEGDLTGAESKISVGKTAFFDETLLHKGAIESARTAFAQIGTPKR